MMCLLVFVRVQSNIKEPLLGRIMNQNDYQTTVIIDQYMEFHYGRKYFNIENYPKKCAQICLQLTQDGQQHKALDLGCAVGRSSFELAQAFDQVIAIDLSPRFIDQAKQLQRENILDYTLINEGELVTSCQASLIELQLDSIKHKVNFSQEDACHLPSYHHHYDLIFAGNLLDRLANPQQFLTHIHQYLILGGILVISTPYTLLTEFTPRQNWLGGFIKNNHQHTVLEGMQTILHTHFKSITHSIDIPFVIRETQRKFQHTIAELNSWQRIR
jgi:putative 4-mercaptohistidine N1-methyltranferase